MYIKKKRNMRRYQHEQDRNSRIGPSRERNMRKTNVRSKNKTKNKIMNKNKLGLEEYGMLNGADRTYPLQYCRYRNTLNNTKQIVMCQQPSIGESQAVWVRAPDCPVDLLSTVRSPRGALCHGPQPRVTVEHRATRSREGHPSARPVPLRRGEGLLEGL